MDTMMNDDQSLPAEGEDEPDSPVFSLTSKGVFDADLIIRDDRWLVIVDAACRDITTTAIAAALRTARKRHGAANFRSCLLMMPCWLISATCIAARRADKCVVLSR